MINSLSVKYLPSSAGMLSGRIFAVTGFQSNKNVKSGINSSRAENRYSHPASLSHEFPLYTSHVGTPDIAKERHNAGNSNISAAPLHDSNSTPLHESTTNIWHNNMTPQSSIIASNFQNRLSVNFIILRCYSWPLVFCLKVVLDLHFAVLDKIYFFIKISTFNKVISNNVFALHSINYSF